MRASTFRAFVEDRLAIRDARLANIDAGTTESADS
jgi:hypothetical protein